MLAVAEAATRQDDRHVLVAMIRRVAKVTGQQYRGVVEQARAVIVRLRETPEEIAPGAHDRGFHHFQLLKLFFVESVMAQRVIPFVFPDHERL